MRLDVSLYSCQEVYFGYWVALSSPKLSNNSQVGPERLRRVHVFVGSLTGIVLISVIVHHYDKSNKRSPDHSW